MDDRNPGAEEARAQQLLNVARDIGARSLAAATMPERTAGAVATEPRFEAAAPSTGHDGSGAFQPDAPIRRGNDDSGLSLEDALGNREFEWRALDFEKSGLWCTFGRIRGVYGPIVAAALGPENASNIVMQGEFRMLMAIRSWRGKPAVPLRGALAFQDAVGRFAISENDVDAQGRYDDYILFATMVLQPDRALDAIESGQLTPEFTNRLMQTGALARSPKLVASDDIETDAARK